LGAVVGGVPFGNGALAHILRNRVYLGAINHKAQSHPGEHEPIIERALFEAVKARLDEQRRGKRRSRTSLRGAAARAHLRRPRPPHDPRDSILRKREGKPKGAAFGSDVCAFRCAG
jgi:hypothetical protein